MSRRAAAVVPAVLPAALLAVLLGALLTACSGDGDDGYCSLLDTESKALNDLADQSAAKDPDYLTDALALFQRLRKAAPADLRDEWDTVTFAWSDLVEALDEAGIEPGEFDPGKRPDSVSAADFAHVRDVAAKLASVRVLDAVSGINDHAQQACEVDLSL